MRFIIGVDEVGRGPLAGPVCVCAFLADKKSLNYITKNCPVEIKDSKKMTAGKRQEVVKFISSVKKEVVGKKDARTTQLVLDYEIISVSPKIIDNKGISFAITFALEKALTALVSRNSDKSEKEKSFNKFTILLDGGLKAPACFNHQETIIKGDDKEIAISLASILAKEYRDSLMKKLSKNKKYSQYGFEQHVGYGTRKHRDAIKKFGLSDIHRRSFAITQ
jgi:ribonuclease HII